MPRGRFISIEGGEGVGKTTQVRLLVEALVLRGIDAVATREPGGTPGAEAIRDLLLQGEADRWTERTEALLFAAGRAEHVARLIRPAVERGQWVICDRFLDSSRAYQGGGSGLSDDDVMTLHTIGSAGLLPDRTLLLDGEEGDVAQRLAARDGDSSDRIGGRDAAFHARVRAAFRGYAEAEPERFRVIDAGGTIAEVQARMLAALADWL